MIDILMSTYNGEKFLGEQIDSLIRQSINDWQLIIRDDGSTDGTVLIIKEYISKFPTKIKLVDFESKNLGSTLSFSRLFDFTESRYIMLCDQDDVWKENKIFSTLQHMISLEELYKDTPIMVYTDMVEVDENLNCIRESFLNGQKIFPKKLNNSLKILALNPVAGCTTMMNRDCLQYVCEIPSKRIIHDQWMAVNISNFGVLSYFPIQSLFYRQHNRNVVGSNNVKLTYFLKKLKSPIKQFKIYHDLITNLKFSINIALFLWYKFSFSISRTLN